MNNNERRLARFARLDPIKWGLDSIYFSVSSKEGGVVRLAFLEARDNGVNLDFWASGTIRATEQYAHPHNWGTRFDVYLSNFRNPLEA